MGGRGPCAWMLHAGALCVCALPARPPACQGARVTLAIASVAVSSCSRLREGLTRIYVPSSGDPCSRVPCPPMPCRAVPAGGRVGSQVAQRAAELELERQQLLIKLERAQQAGGTGPAGALHTARCGGSLGPT